MSEPRKSSSWRWLLSVTPGALWQILFLLLPFLLIVGVSFLSRGDYGEIQKPWTFEQYKRLAGYDILGFDPLYPKILGRSIAIALATGILCTLVALPFVFFLVRLGSTAKVFFLTALLIPVWTNLLVRTYAWQTLLGPQGFISFIFQSLHLVPPETGLYPSWTAVMLCLVCDYLPFAALPIYAAAEKLNWSLVDAAQDLGAGRWATFRHALWPQLRAGIIAGFLFVVLPALGQFVIPDLLGGAKTVLLGNLLQQQFGVSRDWPFGSAITAGTMLLVFAGMFIYYRALRLANKQS